MTNDPGTVHGQLEADHGSGRGKMDKVNGLLLEAIKQALLEPGEHRLFRSGILPGLFAGRSSAASQTAQRAFGQGLLEVVRAEPAGKYLREWARTTPRAVEFVHSHQSPSAALHQLRAALQNSQEGIPLWLQQMRQRLDELANQLTSEVQHL